MKKLVFAIVICLALSCSKDDSISRVYFSDTPTAVVINGTGRLLNGNRNPTVNEVYGLLGVDGELSGSKWKLYIYEYFQYYPDNGRYYYLKYPEAGSGAIFSCMPVVMELTVSDDGTCSWYDRMYGRIFHNSTVLHIRNDGHLVLPFIMYNELLDLDFDIALITDDSIVLDISMKEIDGMACINRYELRKMDSSN